MMVHASLFSREGASSSSPITQQPVLSRRAHPDNGIGGITVFGVRDYAMRIWLNPEGGRSDLPLETSLSRCRARETWPSGILDRPPVEQPGAFQLAVRTLGRLADPDAFSNIIVKQTTDAVVRLKDVAKVQLAAQDYTTNSYLHRDPAVALGIFQLSGSNALATAGAVRSTMDELALESPHCGLKYAIVYNPTEFIQQSVNAVTQTIFEAVVLVVLVLIVFLQTWRAAVIPIVAIPVSLVGTFFLMALFGFSLNTLSLFGLVLAIGVVVDDAIVVVENVERNISAGLFAARGGPPDYGRGWLGACRHRARAVRRVRAGRIHHRHLRAILPAVCPYDCRRDGHLDDRLAHALTGHGGAAAEATRT